MIFLQIAVLLAAIFFLYITKIHLSIVFPHLFRYNKRIKLWREEYD